MSHKLTIFDIEANGLLTTADTIWCIVALQDSFYHIYIKETTDLQDRDKTIYYTDMSSYISFLESCDTLVGHNIISYDLPLLKKLTGFNYKIDPNKIIDTHILSRLSYPDREEHSLEYFGNLLRFPKGKHTDFSQFSTEMVDYCIQDVKLTNKVLNYIQDEMSDWDWTTSIKLEYNIWHIQQKQEQHGVLFDKEVAEKLYEKISNEIQELDTKLIEEIPPRLVNEGELKKIFMKNGEYTKFVKEWYDH